MTDNRNTPQSCGQDGRGTVCIDTRRVLDSCRDRDCYENVRVYLNTFGDEVLASATNIRARSAKVLWAYVGVDEVPFNCGFYRISIRYYVSIELEVCLGIGRTQNLCGIAVLEKNVVLFGGDGGVTTFTSEGNGDFCAGPNYNNMSKNGPIAIVETVEPVILGTNLIDDCCCRPKNDCAHELPDAIIEYLGGNVDPGYDGPRLYVSLGIFSVIRMVREAQLLIQAEDYSVPEKECRPQDNCDPCATFEHLPFPTDRFTARAIHTGEVNGRERRGGCGCR